MQLFMLILSASTLATFADLTESPCDIEVTTSTGSTVVDTPVDFEANVDVVPVVEAQTETSPEAERATASEEVSSVSDAVDSVDEVVEQPVEAGEDAAGNEEPSAQDVTSEEFETLDPLAQEIQAEETEQTDAPIIDESVVDGPVDEISPAAIVEDTDETESQVVATEESTQLQEDESFDTEIYETDELEDESVVVIEEPESEDIAAPEVAEESNEVNRVVEAWSHLNEHTRQAILMLLTADQMSRE